MSPVSLVPIFVLFLLACGIIYLILQFINIDIPKGRFAAIDGFRGVLAFSVFIHHSMIWFYFLKIDRWALPYTVYTHLGPGSVAMFFMITAFLFYSKLLDFREKGMDWKELYISRIYRIMPLYVVAILILFLIAGFESRFILQERPLYVIGELFQWLIFKQPDINNITGSHIIIAGVVWSLAYEWLFYCSLTWVGIMLFKIQTSVKILIMTGVVFILFLIVILQSYPNYIFERICPFAGGITAAFLVRNGQIRKYCSGRLASCLLIIMIPSILLFYQDISALVPFLGICLSFIIIAGGNDIFGLLSHRLLRYLGMISYSVYLLHGMILFTCFRFVIGFEKAAKFSPLEHWLVISICTISLMLISTVTYYFIEKPALSINARRKTIQPQRSYHKKSPLCERG